MNQPLQQPPLIGNTFTFTQAAPHSTRKTNRVESEVQIPQNSKNNFKKEEDAWIILKLPKIVGCTSNNAGAPSITPKNKMPCVKKKKKKLVSLRKISM